MTPLCALLKTYSDWQPSATGGGDHDKTEILTEAAGLLWNLSEASALALEVYNRENLSSLLLRVLAATRGAEGARELRLALLQCLYTATEDNPAAAAAVRAESGQLEAEISGEEEGSAKIYGRVLSVGILLNVGQDEQGDDREGFQRKLWPVAVRTIEQCLKQDQRKMVRRLFDRLNEMCT